jgi:phenylalanyl-tRNA synthetase beta chain
MHSFQVDSIEPAENDAILNIDVLPNRTHDCLSHWGVAREVSSLRAFKHAREAPAFKEPDYSAGLDKIENITAEILKVEINDQNFGSRYLGAVIEGLQIKPSPPAIQRPLAALGVKIINNLVDITNYVMLETGMPLHAFDLDRIEGGIMTLRGSKKGEKITTLDGVTRALPEETLVIEDAKGLIDLAGTMGGARSAVSNTTTRVFLQAAIFDATRIRRSTHEMNFRTEASIRYAADISPALAEIGLMRAIQLLQAEGGTIRGKVDIYPTPASAQPISLEVSYVRRLLGMDVPLEKIAAILKSTGAEVEKKGTDIYMVTPASIRLDLRTPEDLIEEIGRIMGYENIPSAMPTSIMALASPTEEIAFADAVRDALMAAGLTEAYNYSLIPDPGIPDAPTLENPMSDRRNYLRPSLIPGLIKNANDNMRFFDEVRMFEIGKIFKSKIKSWKIADFTAGAPERVREGDDQKSKAGKSQILQRELRAESERAMIQIKNQNFSNTDGINERWSVSGILARKAKPESLFYELKGILSSMCERLRVGEAWFDNYQATPEPAAIPGIWDEARTAEIKIGDTEIGFLGVIRQTEKFAAAAFEVDMESLMRIAREEREFRPVPKYPAVTRDISILVDPDTRISDVENAIENSGAEHIQDVDLFDIFEPDEMGEGEEANMRSMFARTPRPAERVNGMPSRKSFAFHIVYQAADHTLTDEETNLEHAKVEQALREALDAQVR